MIQSFRSACPIASALDIVGDKWTLVVLRTIFAGRHRYNDLLDVPENISTNILANRLALLEEHGLVTRRAYQQKPQRFEYWLTRKGADLLPLLQVMAEWGYTHIPNRWAVPAWFKDATPQAFYPKIGECGV